MPGAKSSTRRCGIAPSTSASTSALVYLHTRQQGQDTLDKHHLPNRLQPPRHPQPVQEPRNRLIQVQPYVLIRDARDRGVILRDLVEHREHLPMPLRVRGRGELED